MIRILVADDHPVVREGLVSILRAQPDFDVVGEAANGEELIREALRTRPDVILMDLQMPGMDGVQALSRLRESEPEVRALVFTAFDTDERILGAIEAGAKGYLLKGAPRDELFNAVRIVSQGGSLLQPIIASRVLQRVNAKDDKSKILTNREAQILHWLAQGKPNKEIAASLLISERTVKFHVSAILEKLGAENRTEAVRIGVQQGLVKL